MILIRGVFFISLLLLSLPNLLQKKMEHMRWVSVTFLFGMIILFFSIIFNYPWVNQAIRKKDQWEVEFISKKPHWNWVTSFFSIMFSFNLQIYALDIKNELLYPSKKRLNKINMLATFYEFLICIFVGMSSYICLGEKYTPHLILMRDKNLSNNKGYESYLTVLTIAFFVLLVYSMPIFNPSTRDYLLDFLKNRNKKRFFKLFSVIPILFVCIISFAYPYVTDILDYFGLTVFAYDAYIIPLLMKHEVLKRQNTGKSYRIVLKVMITTVIAICLIALYTKLTK